MALLLPGSQHIMPKIIAFYLPQFHAIPENDRWWGKGFTEWNNVKSATPKFVGHYQPHIPHRSIGYYDLSNESFCVRQHNMATRHGIYGFCYYYYFFGGRTILEKPLTLFLNNKSIVNKFCLCWANESWTRAWYGQNKEVLIEQKYSDENAIQFYHSIKKYLHDERYITINGKPFLLVYRPEDISDCKAYSDIWRYLAKKDGYEDLFLASVESLIHNIDPEVFGFDAAVEFAPDWSVAKFLSLENKTFRVFDYKQSVANMLKKPSPGYLRFKGAFPGWDNTPRYRKCGISFQNSSLGVFKFFLEQRIQQTRNDLPQDMQYIFINAWNEWGEGCYLEPDEKSGYAKLAIIKELLSQYEKI